MSKLNLLLTLLSLNALLVIVERLSPTTQILLQPYNYLRLHEVFQMSIVITISIIISFLILKLLSNNFETLKSKSGTILGIIFLLGVYFTATGNGAHEIASFLYNTYCNVKTIGTGFCASSYINDYYFGNIVYFLGLFLSNIALILFELQAQLKKTEKKQTVISLANGIFYGLMLTAYAAFDPVLIGFYFVVISLAAVGILVVSNKKKLVLTPFTFYSLSAYLISTILVFVLRFLK